MQAELILRHNKDLVARFLLKRKIILKRIRSCKKAFNTDCMIEYIDVNFV